MILLLIVIIIIITMMMMIIIVLVYLHPSYKCFLLSCSPHQQVEAPGMKSVSYVLNRLGLAECETRGRSACLGRKARSEMPALFFLHLSFFLFFF